MIAKVIRLMPGSIKTLLSSNLRRLQERDGLTQAAIAHTANVDPSTVNHWLKGKNWPSAEALDLLMSQYHWTVAELFSGADSSTAEMLRLHNNSNSPFKITLK